MWSCSLCTCAPSNHRAKDACTNNLYDPLLIWIIERIRMRINFTNERIVSDVTVVTALQLREHLQR